jgi:hypothetical protein
MKQKAITANQASYDIIYSSRGKNTDTLNSVIIEHSKKIL